MAQIAGFHHVSLPATEAERSADWYERVFGFECVLIEEEEDHVKAVMPEHPAGKLLGVHQSPDPVTRWYGSPGAPAVLCFRVASRADLARGDQRLTELGAEHSSPRRAHLGCALDVVDPLGPTSSCTPPRSSARTTSKPDHPGLPAGWPPAKAAPTWTAKAIATSLCSMVGRAPG